MHLILYLVNAHGDWAVLVLKNQVYSGLFKGVNLFVGIGLVQELWNMLIYLKSGYNLRVHVTGDTSP